MPKWYGLFLCFLASMTVFLPCALAGELEGVTSAGFAYAIVDGQGVIRGYEGSAQTLLVPRTLTNEHYPVTSIGDLAFWGEDTITAIRIRSGVTTIGEGAFMECDALEEVVLPPSLSRIETAVFQGCLSLPSVTLPDRIDAIGDYAFNVCMSLTEIEIPSSVRSIGKYAFNRCDILETVHLPYGLSSIGLCAFANCPQLRQIRLPQSLQEMDDDVFWHHADDLEVLYEGSEEEWDALIAGKSGYEGLTVRCLKTGPVWPAPDSSIWMEDGYIRGIPIGTPTRSTKVSALLNQLETAPGCVLTVLSPSGNVDSRQAVVTTGTCVQVRTDTGVLDEMEVVIMGDVNGTGILSIAQLVTMASWLGSPESMTPAPYRLAADWDGNGRVDISDVVREADLLRS